MEIFIKETGKKDHTCILNTRELLERDDNPGSIVFQIQNAIERVSAGIEAGSIEDAYISGLGCQHVKHLETGTNVSPDNFMLALNPHPDSSCGEKF